MLDTGLYLRTQTKDAHEALEATSLAQRLMSPSLTLHVYRDILQVWAAVWMALESAINASPHRASCDTLLPSPRADRALADLEALPLLSSTSGGNAVFRVTVVAPLSTVLSVADLSARDAFKSPAETTL
jgi:hypothetical protein